MRIDILTIFPQFFDALEVSLMGKAQERGVLEVNTHDLRQWTTDRHRSVDDSPYGGGAGMVMRVDIWAQALDQIVAESPAKNRRVVMVPTPSGKPFTQDLAENLSTSDQLIFACGRYEGIDSRFVGLVQDRSDVELCEYSIGDYVLNGGESATLVAIEAIARLLPEVLGNADSLLEESHGQSGLLEYPVYTRPLEFHGLNVPRVLLSGNHADIAQWRHLAALRRTMQMRPDLLQPGGKAHGLLSDLDREQLLAWNFSPEGGLVRQNQIEYPNVYGLQLIHERGNLQRSSAVMIWGPRSCEDTVIHPMLSEGFVVLAARTELGLENELVGANLLLALEWVRSMGSGLALMQVKAESKIQAWVKKRGWKKVPPGLWKSLRDCDLSGPPESKERTIWFQHELIDL